MRPMHKSGERPDKLNKMLKRVSRFALELSIGDDKGAARAESREACRKAKSEICPARIATD